LRGRNGLGVLPCLLRQLLLDLLLVLHQRPVLVSELFELGLDGLQLLLQRLDLLLLRLLRLRIGCIGHRCDAQSTDEQQRTDPRNVTRRLLFWQVHRIATH